MCALFLLASYYGKRLDILVCMSLVAFAMILLTPASILIDIGWQLSFLSLLGIAVLSPKISHILPSKPALLNDILSVTLSAQLATAGLIAFKFGQISIIAPLSNLLVMPFIPLLMLLGFVSAIAGILVPSIAFMTIGRPINWLVVILFDLLSYLASWRFASIKLNTVPLRAAMIYYSAVLAIPFYIRTPTKPLSELEKNDTIDVEKAGPEKRSLPKSAYIEI
jgi:competence protein ComEC